MLYPWDKWLDGRTWRLESGKDFLTHVDSMRSLVYSAAYRNCGKARTSKTEDGDLMIQFFVPGDGNGQV